jgi:tryptophan-rich sensory protein
MPIDKEELAVASAQQTLGQSRPPPAWQRALLSVGAVAAAGALGSVVTRPNIPTWYANLAKPGFTPPNWAFAPAWTFLYLLMAYAAWRILSLPRSTRGRSGALLAFFVQLTLNAGWSWAFFGLHSPLAGLIVIVLLLGAIVLTIQRFRDLDPVASLLLAPYLAWVLYASALNFEIWRLNP